METKNSSGSALKQEENQIQPGRPTNNENVQQLFHCDTKTTANEIWPLRRLVWFVSC